jgi:hypothetical protein
MHRPLCPTLTIPLRTLPSTLLLLHTTVSPSLCRNCFSSPQGQRMLLIISATL